MTACSKVVQVHSQTSLTASPDTTIASLRQVGVSSLTNVFHPTDCQFPLHVKGGGKSVKEVAVENPLSRGGHTHQAGRQN